MPMCPGCLGPTSLVHRRPIDRVLSWFSPRRRFRCKNADCAWEGTLSSMGPPSRRSGVWAKLLVVAIAIGAGIWIGVYSGRKGTDLEPNPRARRR